MTTTLVSPSRRLLARLLLAGASLTACEDTEQSSPTLQTLPGSQGGAPSSTGGTGGYAGDTDPGPGGSNDRPGTPGGATAGTPPTAGGGGTLAGAAGEPGETGGSEASAGVGGEAGASTAGAAGETGGQEPGAGGTAGETGGQEPGQGGKAGASGDEGEAGAAGDGGEIDCKGAPSVDPWVSTEPSELFGCCEEKAAIAKGEYATACCETFHQCLTAEMLAERVDPECWEETVLDEQGCPKPTCFYMNGYVCTGNSPVGSLPRQGELCCYTYWKGSCCGRPIFVASTARSSSLAPRSDWT